jgi:hypothetical protein
MEGAMTMRLPRPRHGDPVETTAELRELAASILREDVDTLARTTAYLRRSYRVVFLGYVAMMSSASPRSSRRSSRE